jgi:hypothetical protein
MFALLALFCFVLKLFHVEPGIDLVVLGLAFIAAHLLVHSPFWPAWRW